MKKVCLDSKFVKSKGFTQKEFSDELGISRTSLQTYLYGKVPFPHLLREKACNLLGIDCDMILFEQEDTDTINREMECQMGSETTRRQFLSQIPKGVMVDSEVLAHMLAAIIRADRYNCIDLQILLNQKLVSLESTKQYADPLRRHILLTIAALPIGLLTYDILSIETSKSIIHVSPDEWLPSCAASLTACWHLMALTGDDILMVEQHITRYLPFLLAWADRSSYAQLPAAYYAAQSFLLLGLVALHKFPTPLNTRERLNYCVLAVKYARIAQDKTLLVTCLTHYGNALYDRHDRDGMLKAYLEADSYRLDIPHLLQSKLSLELGHAYAQHGMVKESLYALKKAQDLFPGEAEAPPFLQRDYGQHSLILFGGLTYLDLGEHTTKGEYIRKAAIELARVDNNGSAFIPQRFLVEIRNQQALVSVRDHNFDDFERYLKLGVVGARDLNSEKRRQEAFSALLAAGRVWPHESKRTMQLAELFE